MDNERKKLWNALWKAHGDNRAVCSHHYARAFVQEYPDGWGAWVVLGDTCAGLALYDEAHKALQTALRLCPKRKRHLVLAYMGHFYKAKCQLRAAERWYRRAVAEAPRQGNLVYLGACLAKQGRFAEAKQMHRRAVKKNRETADEAYFNLGLIYRAEGKYKQALACFEKAIAIDPDYELAKDERADVEALIKILERETGRRR